MTLHQALKIVIFSGTFCPILLKYIIILVKLFFFCSFNVVLVPLYTKTKSTFIVTSLLFCVIFIIYGKVHKFCLFF